MRTIPEVLADMPDPDKLAAMFAQIAKPLTVAGEDQMRAAGDEAYELLRRVGANIDGQEGTGGPGTLYRGAVLVIVSMIQRGSIATCPHLEAKLLPGGMLAAPEPVCVLLARRIIACKACILAIPDDDLEPDDGLCDFCQQPATFFYPILGTVGPIMWYGDFCETCRNGWLTVLPVDH